MASVGKYKSSSLYSDFEIHENSVMFSRGIARNPCKEGWFIFHSVNSASFPEHELEISAFLSTESLWNFVVACCTAMDEAEEASGVCSIADLS